MLPGSPEQGRSALDGVEAMNHMVNMMREHIPQESRIHYVITKVDLPQMLFQILLRYITT